LTLAARNADQLASTAASVADAGEPQQRCTAHPTDVTSVEACDSLVAAHLEQHGGLDVLVLCAGAGHHGLCTESDLDVHHSLMDVNYFGALHCIQAALPALTRSTESDTEPPPTAVGHIVAIGSLSGEVGLPLRSAYCASKHALSGYLESISLEMKMRGIPLTVTNIAPNSVNTDFHKGQERHGPPPKMGPEECADKCMVVFDSGRSGTVVIPRYMKLLTVLPQAVTDTIIARHERRMLEGTLLLAHAAL
jgi:dehydrogenase/reductase SDR family protein 7B